MTDQTREGRLKAAWDALARAEQEALGDHLTYATVKPILESLVRTPAGPPEGARGEGVTQQQLRAAFTNEVIRAIGALARQQNVCREQGGKVVFVTGMEAAREYIVEQVSAALPPPAEANEQTAGERRQLAVICAEALRRHADVLRLPAGVPERLRLSADLLDQLSAAPPAEARGEEQPPIHADEAGEIAPLGATAKE